MSPLEALTRRAINLPGRPAGLPFSDAFLVGDTLYISGRIGIDPVTGQAPADLDAEIKLLLDDVELVLSQAEMQMKDLVSVQIFSPDVSLWDRFNAAYEALFERVAGAGLHRFRAAAAWRTIRDDGRGRSKALTIRVRESGCLA